MCVIWLVEKNLVLMIWMVGKVRERRETFLFCSKILLVVLLLYSKCCIFIVVKVLDKGLIYSGVARRHEKMVVLFVKIDKGKTKVYKIFTNSYFKSYITYPFQSNVVPLQGEYIAKLSHWKKKSVFLSLPYSHFLRIQII